MKSFLIIIVISLLPFFTQAQQAYPTAPQAVGNINTIEYYIDNITAFGSGTTLAGFISSPNINTFTGSIDLSALPQGLHRIYFRSRDADGKWSLSNNAYFDNYNVPIYNTAPATPVNITDIEYYFDNKQLFGEGTPLTGFTSSDNINFNGTISLTGVTPGFHRLFIRAKDANGKWSLTHNAYFDNFTVPVYNPASSSVTNIVQLEYFIDNNDLGFGNCTPIAITPNTNIANLTTNMNITGLTPGIHRVFIRSKDVNGKWSLTNYKVFDYSTAIPYPSAPSPLTNIVQVEYFIDNNDAGFGNCIQIPLTPGIDIANQNANINISGLPAGVHRLFIRAKDADGKWSITNFSVFDNSAIMPYPGAPASAPIISHMEYYIDSDPGFGNATAITIPGNSENISNYAINITLSGNLSDGIHYLYIRSKQNPWSMTNVVAFDANNPLPLIWSYVKVVLNGNKSLVSWATFQEINTQKFEIEHCTNGKDFIKVGETVAAGNSKTLQNYAFTHEHPAMGFNYYRIKQIDIDGNFQYSVIVPVLKKNNLKQTIIAPNPAKDMLHVIEPELIYIERAEIFNLSGSLLHSKAINVEAQVYSLPVAHLVNGIYFIKITYKEESKSYRFVKE